MQDIRGHYTLSSSDDNKKNILVCKGIVLQIHFEL